jgi:hypothetical protein
VNTKTVNTDDGRPSETIVDEGNDDYGSWHLQTLYNLASRSHSGADEKLTEVLRDLDSRAIPTTLRALRRRPLMKSLRSR